MKESNVSLLIDVRDLLARIHDSSVTQRTRGFDRLSLLEMAGLRDSIRTINDVLSDEAKAKEALDKKK